jgi:hypothetical protein
METETRDLLLWGVVAAVVVALAVPWFMWRSDAVVAGLPVWLWWHVGWMGLTALSFYAFARRSWGLGVEPGGGVDG